MKTAISGAGIGGLVLALALNKLGIEVQVYEQAPEFQDNVGGAIGLYPNGLGIIRDISPKLLKEIRALGRPYVTRKWLRHDGTEIATGMEKYLRDFESEKDEIELASMGIRRWKLQNALVQACSEAGIQIYFGKRIEKVVNTKDGKVECWFNQAEKFTCDLLFGCDGLKSCVRTSLFGNETEPKYTGITCLMGSAPIAKTSPISGINFPASSTSKCHACFYPASDEEIIFQIFFPTEEKPETWKPLSAEEGRKECFDLSKLMEQEGWHPMFTEPLANANSVLRTGLRARQPIPCWHAPAENPRVFLVGDAAHPPVPYIGQGAMMAIEDSGILSLLIKKLCKPSRDAEFNFNNLSTVAKLYEELRLPRTTAMLNSSMALGNMQLARSTNTSWYQVWKKEFEIQLQVLRHGTLPIMFFGSRYQYDKEVEKALGKSISKL